MDQKSKKKNNNQTTKHDHQNNKIKAPAHTKPATKEEKAKPNKKTKTLSKAWLFFQKLGSFYSAM